MYILRLNERNIFYNYKVIERQQSDLIKVELYKKSNNKRLGYIYIRKKQTKGEDTTLEQAKEELALRHIKCGEETIENFF